MKTFLTTIIAILLFTITCRAQWTNTGSNIYPTTITNKVGIGITTPAVYLHVFGTGEQLRVAYDASNYTSFTTMSNGSLNLNQNGGNVTTMTSFDYPGISTANAQFRMFRLTKTSGSVAFAIYKGDSSSTTQTFLRGNGASYINASTGNLTVGSATTAGSKFGVAANAAVGVDYYTVAAPTNGLLVEGNVGIGTPTPDQALTVNGTVHSKAVVVDNGIFPDYVFNKTYALRPLSAVKTYIDLNHHLPEMPSAAEVAKKGQNLGEVNALLLKKVEELTLYMIELNKTVKAQQQEIEALKKKN